MVLCDASTDDPLRGRQSRQEPSACPRSARTDTGASRRTQRRPRHRGQPDRGRQARPEGLDGGTACQSGRRTAGRPAALTNGPVPGPMRAGDWPVSRCAYFTFTICRSGTTGSTGTIFISCSPPLFKRCHARTSPNLPCKKTRTNPLRRASDSSRRSAAAQLFRQSSRRLTSRWIRTNWMPLSRSTKPNPPHFLNSLALATRAGPRSCASGRRPAHIATCLLPLERLH
jgi:hypothetical protein